MMKESNLNESLRSLRKATIIWVSLILLTCLAGMLAESSVLTPILILIVLTSLVIKAQLITDNFMGLKGVKLGWRLSMAGFSIVISTLAWILY